MYQNTILKYYFIFLQFLSNYNDDFISIQEIDFDGNQRLVEHLTGPDLGPKSESAISNWDKKIISSSTNRMNIEFKSDDELEYKGFSANIYFTPFPNTDCESWLDMNKKTLISPNYPQTYDYSFKCSWLITVVHDYHITLDVSRFNVIYQMI